MTNEIYKYYCYILTNKNRTVTYIGYTYDIEKRIQQHKKGRGALFTKRYNVHDLIYFEEFDSKKKAKKRESQLKNWHKEWKWNLIKEVNPNLETLKIS
ncbi:MAG: GIY-YIG nuclease family protein [Flavobacteriaceae bacterium]